MKHSMNIIFSNFNVIPTVRGLQLQSTRTCVSVVLFGNQSCFNMV